MWSQHVYPESADSKIVSVAIADDYPVLLAGIRQFLAPCDDIFVVAECLGFSELRSQVASKKPRVVLLGCDSTMEELAGWLHSLVEQHADAKVILFTGNASLHFHEVALRNGAKGVLLKHSAPETVARTIRKVARGGLCFDPQLTERMLASLVRRKVPEAAPVKAGISSLTGRENEIISRICEGMRNKEIASKLFISDATVAHHLTSIYRKLGLADRTELLLYAHHNGISPLRAS
jgi:DNA-binding NarL/FixJ family response regulator